MNALINFNFEEHLVRVVTIESEPWWVASDVARVLGFRHTPHMVRLLDDDEKGVRNVDTLGGRQELSIVSLSGVLHATLKSRRPEARQFRRWVTGEVLPQILHTGKYAPSPADEEDRGSLPHNLWDPTMIHAVVGELRLSLRIFGPDHTRQLWRYRRMPMFDYVERIAGTEAAVQYRDEFMAERLAEWLANHAPRPTLNEIFAGLGFDIEDRALRERVRRALRGMGWWSKKARGRTGRPVSAWFPPEHEDVAAGRDIQSDLGKSEPVAPAPPVAPGAPVDGERLLAWLSDHPRPTTTDIVAALGYAPGDRLSRRKVILLLHELGWWQKVASPLNGEKARSSWFPPEQAE